MLNQQFISRLKKLTEKGAIPEELLKRINANDLQSIILVLINDATLEERIMSLTPGTGFRLDKQESGLERTITILRAQDGELECILETENLDAQNKSCEVEEFDGLIKKGRQAWRLDGPNGPEKYASLYVELSKKKKFNSKNQAAQARLASIQKEVAFSWSLPKNDYVLTSRLGPIYSNENGTFVSIHSLYGIRLDDIDQYNLTQAQHQEIISKVLEGLVFLEKNDIIHGDIKPANVLVFLGKDNRICVKFIDFGTICNIKGNTYQNALHATPGYESPEIALVVSEPSHPDHQEYEAVYADVEGKNYAKLCADKMSIELREKFKSPHPKNDVWATGVMLHEFLHEGAFLDKLPDEPFLRGMLEADREKRFDAATALKEWKKSLEKPAPIEMVQRHYLPSYRTVIDKVKSTSFVDKVSIFAHETYGSFKRLFKGV